MKKRKVKRVKRPVCDRCRVALAEYIVQHRERGTIEYHCAFCRNKYREEERDAGN
jgi:redox-regulated HSP33 family molecular chaperone